MQDKSAAWCWVLEHHQMIERVAAKCSKGLCADDLCSRLLIELVESFDSYDQDRGTAVSWVYWRARKVRIYMFRETKNTVLTDESILSLQPASDSTPSKIEQGIRIKEILSVATPKQAEACFSVLNGLSGRELREVINMSPQCGNDHLYKLGGSFHRKRRLG